MIAMPRYEFAGMQFCNVIDLVKTAVLKEANPLVIAMLHSMTLDQQDRIAQMVGATMVENPIPPQVTK